MLLKLKMIAPVALSIALAACNAPLAQDEEVDEKESSNVSSESSEDFSEYYSELQLSSSDEADSDVGVEDQDSLLSDEAQSSLETAREVMKSYHDQARAICSKNSELHDEIRAKFDAVIANDELSRLEKHQEIKTIKSEYLDQLIADREAFRSCVSENEEALSEIRELRDTLAEACLLRSPKAHGPKHMGMARGGKAVGPKGGMKFKRPKLNETLAAELEEKLASDTCQAIINPSEETEETSSDDATGDEA